MNGHEYRLQMSSYNLFMTDRLRLTPETFDSSNIRPGRYGALRPRTSYTLRDATVPRVSAWSGMVTRTAEFHLHGMFSIAMFWIALY